MILHLVLKQCCTIEEGLEACVQVYGECLSQSRDSIKVYELHNFTTLAKAVFVALEMDLVHL